MYLDPDGRPRTNPDGTEQRYTLADVERLLNPRGPGGRGLAGAGPAMPQGPQAPLIAPQRVPAGVIPDFIWRNLSKGRIERNVPLTFEQGPTMDVILPSKKDQEMFGELVRAHGPHELFLRYMAASEHPEAMQASDWAELGHLLEEFGHRKLLLEEVQTNLTKEDVTFMLVHNPAFASIRFNLKPERAMEVMKTSMSYLFMRGSHDEINAMVLSQRANRDIRESDYYIGLNERVHYHTDKTGIKADDLDWNRLDPKLQKQILKPGLLGWMFHGEKTKRSRATLEHIQTNRASMGYLLAGTVSNDPVLISRIVREAQTGERVPQVGERGVGTAADARTERRHINEELNENALLEQVRNPEFRANFRDLDGRTWDNSTPEAREEAFFADSERDLTQRQTLLGWFSNFLSALFSVRLDRAKQRLATEGAFN
ncbi:hypothetical protein A2764_02640 [Candidatus Kaiserbacteria bacterium RIFCSPHIGHO2_01_FULL_55_79]|nr:MAG: hypothetical protein A2764_02640 [Candidatus Kaiserbacteria bacterium RIFCSPHIGHO2_01_FULL_55_79]